MALRHHDWKLVFEEQRATSTQVWAEPLVKLRVPLMLSLRRDPFERANFNSNVHYDWLLSHDFLLNGAQALVAPQNQELRQILAAPESGLLQPLRGAGTVNTRD
jgi:hypothetical protein